MEKKTMCYYGILGRHRPRGPQRSASALSVTCLCLMLCTPTAAVQQGKVSALSHSRAEGGDQSGSRPIETDLRQPETPTGQQCRDSIGWLPPAAFQLRTCGMCFLYLYYGKGLPVAYHLQSGFLLFFTNETVVEERLLPDVGNKTVVEQVCRAVRAEHQDCQRWLTCCQAAEVCCQGQLQAAAAVSAPPLWKTGGRLSSSSSGGPEASDAVSAVADAPAGKATAAAYVPPAFDPGLAGGGRCPATWDGYSCWSDAEGGTAVTQRCAAYIDGASTSLLAVKVCSENGSWYKQEDNEWTDYSGCISLSEYSALFWVGLVANIISLLLLIPACIIFLYFRSLRSQHRIKLHVCLFFSYIFTNVCMIIWDVVIVYDRLYNNTGEDNIVNQNSVGCRLLHALSRYAWLSNFTWMFLEGLHLYRLMVHAFAVPRSLLAFYIGGFSVPWVPTVIYVSVRVSRDDLNTRCWIEHAKDFEWLIYLPIILCLVGNVLFLVKILYVMLTQLQSHPNEPSSYRRAVKAAGILIPLFGLQAVLVIAKSTTTNFAFEGFHKFITNTQGAFVAIGFCYLNGEVLTVVRNSLPRSLRSRSLLRSDQRSTVSTQFTTDARTTTLPPAASQQASSSLSGPPPPGSGGYIPLSTLGDEGRHSFYPARNGEKERLQNGVV